MRKTSIILKSNNFKKMYPIFNFSPKISMPAKYFFFITIHYSYNKYMLAFLIQLTNLLTGSISTIYRQRKKGKWDMESGRKNREVMRSRMHESCQKYFTEK